MSTHWPTPLQLEFSSRAWPQHAGTDKRPTVRPGRARARQSTPCLQDSRRLKQLPGCDLVVAELKGDALYLIDPAFPLRHL